MIFILIVFFRLTSIVEKGKTSLENFDYGLLTKNSKIIKNKKIIFTVTTFFDFKKKINGPHFVMVWIVYLNFILI